MRFITRNAVLYPVMMIIAIVQFFPFLWLILGSFKDNDEFANSPPFSVPSIWRISNYVQAWTGAKVSVYFLNSMYVSLTTLLFVLLLSAMMAYGLTRMHFKWNGIVLLLLIAGIMIPVHATLIPLFLLMKNLGILSTLWSVILPYTVVNLPIGVSILSAFMRSMPKELEEAAYLDGCGVIRSFFSVVLPVLRPAMATVAIFTFLAVWNELIMAVTFIQKTSLRTLPLGLMSFSGQYTISWGPLAAAIVISTIPIIMMFILFSEQMEKSFTAGAILK